MEGNSLSLKQRAVNEDTGEKRSLEINRTNGTRRRSSRDAKNGWESVTTTRHSRHGASNKLQVAAERTTALGGTKAEKEKRKKKRRTEEHHDDAKADDALTTNPPGCSRQPNTWERTPILPFRSILPYCTDTLRYAKTHPPPTRSSTTVPPSSTHVHTPSALHSGLYWSGPSDPLCQTSNTTLRHTRAY